MFLFIACKGILGQINSGIGMAQDIFTTGKCLGQLISAKAEVICFAAKVLNPSMYITEMDLEL
jgi:hypothetical protein